MSLNVNTPAGQVRLLCTDITEPYVFDDDAIDAFLSLSSGNVKRAAAMALDVIAADEALVIKVVRTDDLQVDGVKVAESLRKQAEALRAQADAETDQANAEVFVVVYPDQCKPRPEAVPRWF